MKKKWNRDDVAGYVLLWATYGLLIALYAMNN
jgi:hypothetical protein